jgi:DNA repair protein RadC
LPCFLGSYHAVLAVKAVRAARRAVLRESASPSLDGSAAAWGSRPRGQFRPLKRITTMAHTLYIRDGETFSEAQPQDIIDRAATLIAQRFRTGAPVLDSPDRTRQYLRHQIGALPYEVFGLLLLDNRHRLIRSEILFRGTIDGAAVHPREVVRVVFDANAAAVIMYHNHPSGIAEPSQADELLTRRLREALQLIDVRVLDHLIIGDTAEYSFAETGRL